MTKPNKYQLHCLMDTIFDIHDYLLKEKILDEKFIDSDFFQKNEWILKPEKSYSSCFLKLENNDLSVYLSFGEDPDQRYKVTISGKFILFSNSKNSYITNYDMLGYFIAEKMNFVDKINKKIDNISFTKYFFSKKHQEYAKVQNVIHDIQSKKFAEQDMFRGLEENGYSNIQKIKKDETHKFTNKNEYKYFLDTYVVDKDGESFLVELGFKSGKHKYSIKNNENQMRHNG